MATQVLGRVLSSVGFLLIIESKHHVVVSSNWYQSVMMFFTDKCIGGLLHGPCQRRAPLTECHLRMWDTDGESSVRCKLQQCGVPVYGYYLSSRLLRVPWNCICNVLQPKGPPTQHRSPPDAREQGIHRCSDNWLLYHLWRISSM